MSYREDLDALSHRVNALEQQASSTEEELRTARALLAQAQANRRVSVLDNIEVAAPCKADWSQMTGDDRARHCAQCDKNVFDLSNLSRPEAEALILSKEGKLCVRFYRRADGTILTADCPEGLKGRRRKRRVMAAAFGAFGALSAAAAVVTIGHRGSRSYTMGAVEVYPNVIQPAANSVEPPAEPVEMVMGEIAPMPAPAQRPACRLPTRKPAQKIQAKK